MFSLELSFSSQLSSKSHPQQFPQNVLLEIITYNLTLERVGASNRYISHGQSSSLKAFFEIELGPLDFNMVLEPLL
jgi:hypothetical protein